MKMIKKWHITNITVGSVDVPGRPTALSVGESYVVVDPLTDRHRELIGMRLIKASSFEEPVTKVTAKVTTKAKNNYQQTSENPDTGVDNE
jgi:hypothetical protein